MLNYGGLGPGNKIRKKKPIKKVVKAAVKKQVKKPVKKIKKAVGPKTVARASRKRR